jgi:cytochrome o ubiquinol oxidase subunit II
MSRPAFRRANWCVHIVLSEIASLRHFVLLDPKGPIGADEKSIIILATALMLIVVIPVIVMAIVFPWRYRASNTRATYAPNWSHSGRIEAVVWLVPCLIIAVLATVTWVSSHDLDPYKPIASTAKPIEVQVVSLDWKWLFIYPTLNIASVNELAFPAGTPVHFALTSSSVMTSFFIPQLGSQIYTMSGMQTQLSLLANEPGNYMGIAANYSGGGFSDMTFQARAMTDSDFAAWVEKVRTSHDTLTPAVYRDLEKPTEKVPVAYYSAVGSNIFHDVLNKCANGAMCTDDAMKLSMASETLGSNVGLCRVPQKKVIE